MKTLKFRKKLSELILKKEKTTTWRIFDDKETLNQEQANLEREDFFN